MTDQPGKAMEQSAVDVGDERAARVAPNMSRRALIRGASIAAPSILTLSSASAQMAMSSTMIVSGHDRPADTDYVCLDEETTAGFVEGSNALELDPTRAPTAYRYPERDYVMPKSSGGCGGGTASVSERDMCGGTLTSTYSPNENYCYNDKVANVWRQVEVKNGILLSASTMTSIAGLVVDRAKEI